MLLSANQSDSVLSIHVIKIGYFSNQENDFFN